ncbi:molecular chaperone DnaJ [Nitzschia inconspicua]|uniref:Molecular chaperone DnaJ n=1 Tax=Nitzschia inconspicua TaxID=303405 RepID=A0A9K3LQT0_9STRA|nr:molecular chaperone DnaJ [Nitzschia inconspicua]
MASLMEQAFGQPNVDLYADVLKVPKTCTPAQLRKAYYKQALQYHPDKNDTQDAKLKFQAISWAYNYLKDPDKRQDYDQEGIIPQDDQNDDDDDDMDNGARKSWKDYFDTIFGKLSVDDIDNFAMKYKMSEEEEKDVLENYTKFQGNLVKMLEFVMLSEERDVSRWMEDYIQPAIAEGKVENYEAAVKKAMLTIDKKLAKEKKNQVVSMEDFSTDETETEESDNDLKESKLKASKTKTKAVKKAKPTQAKKRSQKKNTGSSSQNDLIAMIRNKNGRGNPLASIAARYGVSNVDEDPLDDAAFAKLQSKMKKK